MPRIEPQGRSPAYDILMDQARRRRRAEDSNPFKKRPNPLVPETATPAQIDRVVKGQKNTRGPRSRTISPGVIVLE